MNIKEIETRSGLTRANIRYYEQEGLLAPERRENRYRDYSEADLETLLRIALLRNLGFSLDEIRALQSGETALDDAMRRRGAALEVEGQRVEAARNVCIQISHEVTSYSALQPGPYLASLRPDAAASARDIPAPHPWRRYFARAIDLSLAGLPLSFVRYVLLHGSVLEQSTALRVVLELLAWGLLIFLEPLLLSRFGTTAGKWCMGITVTHPDGSRLRYGEALSRTALVWVYGAGFALPLIGTGCSVYSYYCYTHGRDLAWEDGSVERFDGRGEGRMLALYAASFLATWLFTILMGLAGMLPPHKGELTVTDFAENVNFYRTYFDYGARWSLDENGAWTEEKNGNTVYIDLGTDGQQTPFVYTVDDGVLRGVRWEYQESGASPFYSTGVENARIAYLALAAAQKGTTPFNILRVVRQIRTDEWAEDRPYRAEWKSVAMTYDAQIEGDYYAFDGAIVAAPDPEKPLTLTLTFDARLTQ